MQKPVQALFDGYYFNGKRALEGKSDDKLSLTSALSAARKKNSRTNWNSNIPAHLGHKFNLKDDF
jgi:hypothetical protein